MAHQFEQLFPQPSLIVDVGQTWVPVSGGTITIPMGHTVCLLNNAALLAVLGIVMPIAPLDLQRLTIACGAAITLLNMSTADGTTIKGALTSLAVSGYARYIYSAAAGAWFRTG